VGGGGRRRPAAAAWPGHGGGKVPALARALHGARRVARTLAAWGHQGQRLEGVALRRAEVNGQPGVMILDADERVISVMALDIADDRVQGVRSVINPDKLRHLGPVADMRALLERAARRTPG
jgi:hypothetical protein